VLDQRGRLLVAALGFAGRSMPRTTAREMRCGPGWTRGRSRCTARATL